MTGPIVVSLAAEDDAPGWRRATRALLAEGAAPQDVVWEVGGAGDLFGGADGISPTEFPEKVALTLPRAAVELIRKAIDHSDPGRFSRLYRYLWRCRQRPAIAANPADEDGAHIRRWEKAVRRDLHKMHAFLRFREVPSDTPGRAAYAAWFEPDHHIVETTAPFFIRRFANMDWTIITPRKSIRWIGETLQVGDGGRREDVPEADAFDVAWSAYFTAIFNPARVKIKAMTAEMPKKYWKNLPEARHIPALLAEAEDRVRTMRRDALAKTTAPSMDSVSTAIPATLEEITAKIHHCTACPLHLSASRAVIGEGPNDADLMIVGEQPGDQEDLEGRPFIGPAGQLLTTHLAAIGLRREDAYITNAVKRFKFTQRGKRRLHQSPSAADITACAPHLHAEIAAIRPRAIIALGATALRAILGRPERLARVRGEVLRLTDGTVLIPTFHPAYLLRLTDPQARQVETRKFAADLAQARAQLVAPQLANDAPMAISPA